MFRALITLCYTATALLGPGACCCSFQALLDLCPSVAHAAEPTPPAKRSCCSAGHDESTPKPAEKSRGKAPADSDSGSDCPCKQAPETHQPVHPPTESGVELVNQHYAFCFLLTDGLTAWTSDVVPAGVTASGTQSWSVESKLANRSLLTSLHILRC